MQQFVRVQQGDVVIPGLVSGAGILDLRSVVSDITPDPADYIFGYVCINDVSDRSTQVDADNQQHLVRAKSRPTYGPIGPYLTTGINPMDLDVWTKVNRRFEQQGNTSDMLFPVDEIVAYFSRHVRMVPGDILATGTPPGVGMGKNRFLDVGDILECGITKFRCSTPPDRCVRGSPNLPTAGRSSARDRHCQAHDSADRPIGTAGRTASLGFIWCVRNEPSLSE